MAHGPEKKDAENQKTPPPARGSSFSAAVKLILAISTGLLWSRTLRRNTMFACMLAAVVLLFCGVAFFDAHLTERPWLFLAYWALCAALTGFGFLLAIYDMLMVRRQSLLQRRKLRESIFGGDSPQDPDREDRP